MILAVSRLRATSLHDLPSASRSVSSISGWSSNSVTTSPLPSDAARCNAVVPDSGGWIELGEIERWDKRSSTVSPVLHFATGRN